jgi:hypothetical protein
MKRKGISTMTGSHHYWLLLGVSAVVVPACLYLAVVCIAAYYATKQTERTEFFTCDKHGAFPVKLLMSIDLGDGRPVVQQCPFCYEEAFKKADARIRADEAKHGTR